MEKDNKLNSKVYDLVDELETQQIDDNDTGQLADILNDYMTEINPSFTQDLVTEEIEDLQIENNNEIDIAVDEREILKQENEDLTLIGNETLLNLHLQDEALRQDLQSTTSRESHDVDVLALLGDADHVPANTQVVDEELETDEDLEAEEILEVEEELVVDEVEEIDDIEDTVFVEDITNDFTYDNLENFNDEEITEAEQTDLDLAILALSKKVEEVKANPEHYTQKTATTHLDEDELEEQDFSVTQTLISPTVMDIDSSDLTQEAEIVETTSTDVLDDITDEQTQAVIDVDEVNETDNKWHQLEQTTDVEAASKARNVKEDLQKTIELENFTDVEEVEFSKESEKGAKSAPRKLKAFDWFLIIVIIVLTFILIKMLLNK